MKIVIVRRFFEKAWEAFRRITSKVLERRYQPFATKIRMLRCYVSYVYMEYVFCYLYGVETRTLTELTRKKIEDFETRMCRRVLKISRTGRITKKGTGWLVNRRNY